MDPRYLRQPATRAERHGDGRYARDGLPSTGLFSPLTQLHSAFHKRHETRKRSESSPMAMAYNRATQNRRAIQLPPRPFSFRQRQGKLDTRTIAQIDLNKVVRETDIDTIQNHLENLAFSDVTLQDVNQYSDEYFLKLFQVAQLTVEYLLNVQESLVLHTEDLETQCDHVAADCKTLEAENQTFDAEVKLLKQEIQQKQNTIATFEMMLLTQQRSASVPATSPTPAPVDCVFCNKKFLSTEYLVKHQKKKHFDDYSKLRATKSGPPPLQAPPPVHAPPPVQAPPPIETPPVMVEPAKPAASDVSLVSALVAANTTALTKQLETLQAQLLQDKSERAKETQLLQQQQNAFAQSIVEQMARMQQALQDMQAKTQTEWMHFTEEILKAKPRPADHIGHVMHDTDDKLTREMVQDLMQQREKELARRLELEAEQREWAARELQLQKQLLDEKQKQTTNELTLTHLMALEAQKYGLDYGLPPSAAPTVVVVERGPPPAVETPVVAAEEPKQAPPPCLVRQPSIQVPDVVPTPVPAKAAPPKPVVVEAPPPKPTPVAAPVVAPVPAPAPTLVEIETPPAVVEAPPMPEAPTPAPSEDAQLRRLHAAATTIRRVTKGFLTRSRLAHPHSWHLRLQGHDVLVPVTRDTTALDVRRVIASELGNIDLHRVLLHDVHSGDELPGSFLVFETNGHLEIEIIPAMHDDMHHFAVIDELVIDLAAQKGQIQSLRTETLPAHVRPENATVLAALVRLQSVARGMLARREAASRRIDRLVDARLAQLQAPPVVIAHKPTLAEVHTRKVTDALHAKLVAFKVGKSADRIPRQLSKDAYEASMKQLTAAREAQPPEVQARIAGLLSMIHDVSVSQYDAAAAKEKEATATAATSIQSIARAALARKMLQKMLAKHAPAEASLVTEGTTQRDAEATAKPTDDNDDEAKPSAELHESVQAVDEAPPKATSSVTEDEGVMTIDEFNDDEPKPAPATSEALEKAVLQDEYEEERAKLAALKEASARVISPFSRAPLQSMRSAKRGSSSQNAR
ncbi:hypothetical protein SDRG_01566 [Saprolegnia diclina VS20]|uniref:C2H2-type domain-containing protein n=1 Tax=Saprolegnia diclina (strain VS20) TaxID=1156394 RepID=T0SFA3_SAPDV|nr:hypothetical protein SDRG_01566 [Saprolegnia diclina VS20]EQC41607.1 hypothetical protein SDRG_01566 [Saprolegnia diclina VS20]|eukprot:XP_008605321.1 hypothetical protein SDRG_01566 [Saprolegnia diclina VS20]